MAVTRPAPTLVSTSQHPDATNPSFSNKLYLYSMVLMRGLGSRFPSASSQPSKFTTFWYREWANVILLTSMMYWRIIVIISLMSSWKYWQRGVSDCPTMSIDVRHGPPFSTVWSLDAIWTFSMTQPRRRRRAREITYYRMSISPPTRAAMPFSVTRMSSGGPMELMSLTLTLLITIKTARAPRQPIQTAAVSGASKQTSMAWTWVILKQMTKLSPAGRPPASSSLSMTVS